MDYASRGEESGVVMLKRGEYVSVQKLAPVEGREDLTPTFDEYNVSKTSRSIPVNYKVVGSLYHDLKEGSSMVVWRDERNGVKVEGMMTTSKVESIEKLSDDVVQVNTENSVYLVSRHTLSGESNYDVN